MYTSESGPRGAASSARSYKTHAFVLFSVHELSSTGIEQDPLEIPSLRDPAQIVCLLGEGEWVLETGSRAAGKGVNKAGAAEALVKT
ncbi:hypothetical protein E4U58_002802 [Claviceps cyperi]|nr:hypothetical protein E4U58_002802 [Claviceps cyperi]